MPPGNTNQGGLYDEASNTYSSALERLAGAYEADPDKRRDLLQKIHLALWCSFEHFEARCSLRTWVYRIAHNTATSHVIHERRTNPRTLVGLEELETASGPDDQQREAEQRMSSERLLQLIHRLKPLDRQVMLLYLEGMDTASIGEITGISPGGVRTQIHRIKSALTRRFHEGGCHET